MRVLISPRAAPSTALNRPDLEGRQQLLVVDVEHGAIAPHQLADRLQATFRGLFTDTKNGFIQLQDWRRKSGAQGCWPSKRALLNAPPAVPASASPPKATANSPSLAHPLQVWARLLLERASQVQVGAAAAHAGRGEVAPQHSVAHYAINHLNSGGGEEAAVGVGVVTLGAVRWHPSARSPPHQGQHALSFLLASCCRATASGGAARISQCLSSETPRSPNPSACLREFKRVCASKFWWGSSRSPP